MEIRLDGNLHGFRTRLRRSRRLRQYNLERLFRGFCIRLHRSRSKNAVRNARRKQRNHESILPLPIKVENRSVPSGFLHIGSIFAGSTRANHRRLMEIRLDGNLHGFRTRLRRSRRLRQYTLSAFFVDSASVYIGQGDKMRSGTPGESRRNGAIRCIHRMAPFVFRRFRISYLYL